MHEKRRRESGRKGVIKVRFDRDKIKQLEVEFQSFDRRFKGELKTPSKTLSKLSTKRGYRVRIYREDSR